MTNAKTWLSLSCLALAAACGGAIPDEEGGPNASAADTASADDLASCRSIQWWNGGYSITSNRKESYGWWDTDLAVRSSTPVQLRHASKLIAYGVYGWGYMPTFVDQVTGHEFRFLHLRPQHKWMTRIGHVYPAGSLVGVSGGDTWDTGGAGRGYSTGPHLCVQTIVGFRGAFPQGTDRCQ